MELSIKNKKRWEVKAKESQEESRKEIEKHKKEAAAYKETTRIQIESNKKKFTVAQKQAKEAFEEE